MAGTIWNKWWLTLGFLILRGLLVGQSDQCSNAGFENGTLSGWVGYTGNCCGINTPSIGFSASQHEIMTGTGVDPYACQTITVVAPGSDYSVRLGNSGTGAQAERLRYSFLVDEESTLITYKYAVVLEDPSHSEPEQPRFEAQVLDQNGVPISCTFYKVSASGSIPGFQSCGVIRSKNWTTVGVDVSDYIGQTVTLDIATGDCSQGGHFGYAYVDASCGPLEIDARYCLDNGTSFLSAPEGFESYQWSTGQNTREVTLVNAQDNQLVTCTITSVTGCQATLTAVLAPSTTTVDFDPIKTCTGLTELENLSVIENGIIETVKWESSDGFSTDSVNFKHQYAQPGTYDITLIVISDAGCSDTLQETIEVFWSPEVDFAANDMCDGETLSLNSLSTIANNAALQNEWHIEPGLITLDGPTHDYIFPAADTFDVELLTISPDNCRDSLTRQVIVYPNPVADFTFVEVCQDQPVVFTNSSTTYSSSPQYSWQVPFQGVTSQELSPSLSFSQAGISPTSLIVTDVYVAVSCRDTLTRNVFHHAIPDLQISGDTAFCFGPPLTIDNVTVLSTNENVNYQWLIDGALFAQTEDLLYQPGGAPLQHTVEIRSVTDFGCQSSDSFTALIHPNPTSNFSFIEVCENLPVVFTDLSSVNTATPAYDWQIPSQGLTSTETSPTFNFTQTGNSPVSLIITETFGAVACRDTMTKDVFFHAIPDIQWSGDTAFCLGSSLDIVNETVLSTNEPMAFQWFIDGVLYSVNDDMNFTPVVARDYPIEVRVITPFGCGDTTSFTHVAHPNPIADFTFTEVCEDTQMEFVNLSTAHSANPAYRWSAPVQNLTSSEESPTLGYTVTGISDMELIITETYPDASCADTLSLPVFYHATPIISWVGDTTLCIGDPLLIDQTTALSSDEALIFDWNVDTQPYASTEDLEYLPAAVRDYPVQLISSTPFGCADTIQFVSSVYGIPTVQLLPSDTSACIVMDYAPRVNVTNFNGSILSYSWTFGNGEISDEEFPETQYPDAGVYTVTISVTTGDQLQQCASSDQGSVTAWPLPVSNFGWEPGEILESDPVVYFSEYAEGEAFYNWNFGTGDSTHFPNPEYVFPYFKPVSYDVCLEVESIHGCLDEICYVVHITDELQLFVPNSFTPNGDGLNDVFRPVIDNAHLLTYYDLIIYDRWGTVVFETSDPDDAWTGNVVGGAHYGMNDAYNWKLVYSAKRQEKEELVGSVILVR